jgi:2,3-bisphosphoglycerate-dependent phosphoglycerate mutase
MSKRRILIFCLFLMPAFMTLSTQAQTTTVYIVRHAEKDMKNASDPDPVLSLDGQDRARDLASLLLPKRVLAVYSTTSKRAKQTAEPTAYGHAVTVQTYDPADPAALVATVLRQYKGGSVLVVGHSNTVLELIEAFGFARPIPAVGENDYDYLFTITVQGNSNHLLTSNYGKLHRVTVQK